MSLIDGQQRTTTFLLFLKAILIRIDEALENFPDDEDSAKLKVGLKTRKSAIMRILFKIDEEEQLDIEKDWKNLDTTRTLITNKSINEQYKEELSKILFSKEYSDVEKEITRIPKKLNDNKFTNFFKNFRFFYDKLKGLYDNNLNVIAKTFLEKCQVIEIKSWQIEQAITMFNSLNSTGMPLTDADIISAQLYANAADRSSYIKIWEEIKQNAQKLENNKITNLDGILQQSMYMHRAQSKIVSTSTPALRKFYTEEQKNLLKEPNKLCATLKKIEECWLKASGYPLVKILLQLNENARLFLISYMMRFNIDELSEEKISSVTSYLIRLFAIYELVETSYSSDKFKTFLFNANTQLVNPDIPEETIIATFKQHISNKWKLDEIKEAINNYDGKAIVFLNDYLFAKENNKKFNFKDNVNIEHIMPDSGRNLSQIRKDAGLEDENEFKLYVNKIGNKILLEEDINKSISNDWFRTKKQSDIKDQKGYKNSIFALAASLVDYQKDTWTKDDIQNATQKATSRLTKFIFEIDNT